MIRLHVICEGQTEEIFVKEILAPHFASRNVHLYPSLVGKPGQKGGNVTFQRIAYDIRARLTNDRESFCTTFFDYYGLQGEFPGKKVSESASSLSQKAALLEQAFATSLAEVVTEDVLRRFVPYVQFHEFESLLFSKAELIPMVMQRLELLENFENIRRYFATPEDINNSPLSSPSKRILALIVNYNKTVDGNLIAIEIGLDAMRRECSLFSQWLTRLEALPGVVSQ